METALYLPVKRFLEKLGFTVKGEVGGCDLVALSGDEPPIVVIGELKLSFNLELGLQESVRSAVNDLRLLVSGHGAGAGGDAATTPGHSPAREAVANGSPKRATTAKRTAPASQPAPAHRREEMPMPAKQSVHNTVTLPAAGDFRDF